MSPGGYPRIGLPTLKVGIGGMGWRPIDTANFDELAPLAAGPTPCRILNPQVTPQRYPYYDTPTPETRRCPPR